MQIVVYTAIVMIAAGFGVVFGGWLVNNSYRHDAENGNACLIGGKIYKLTEVTQENGNNSTVSNSTVSSNIHKEGK